MSEHNLTKMMEMPDEWWRRITTCEVLLNCFSRHTLGLQIVAIVNGETKAEVLSGFLVCIQQQILWFTASHVVSYIELLLSNPEVKIRVMRWLDLCEIEGAESIPVHDRNLSMFKMPEDIIDWGIVRIDGLDRVNLLNNKRIQLLDPKIWQNLHLGEPEGYYVLGWPLQEVDVNQNSVRASMTCIPLVKLEYDRHKGEGEFWGDPDAFYGKIMPFAGDSEVPSIDIKGMSGGPLLSIERKPDKGFLYRLYGVQRSWDKKQRIIRAEPMHKILEIIEAETA